MTSFEDRHAETQHPGVYGAKVASWSEKNYKTFYADLRAQYPEMKDKRRGLAIYLAELKKLVLNDIDDPVFESSAEYSYTGAFNSFREPKTEKQLLKERAERAEARARQQEEDEAAAQEMAVKKAKSNAMNIIMPNGKKLGDCMKQDHIKLAKHYGKIGREGLAKQKFHMAIAKKLGRGETTRDKFSNAELKQLSI